MTSSPGPQGLPYFPLAYWLSQLTLLDVSLTLVVAFMYAMQTATRLLHGSLAQPPAPRTQAVSSLVLHWCLLTASLAAGIVRCTIDTCTSQVKCLKPQAECACTTLAENLHILQAMSGRSGNIDMCTYCRY